MQNKKNSFSVEGGRWCETKRLRMEGHKAKCKLRATQVQPDKHGRVVLLPCKKWRLCTLLYSSVYWTSHVFHSTRNTLPCITSHPVQGQQFYMNIKKLGLNEGGISNKISIPIFWFAYIYRLTISLSYIFVHHVLEMEYCIL